LNEIEHQVKIGTRDKTRKEVVEWVVSTEGQVKDYQKMHLLGNFAEAISFVERECDHTLSSWSGSPNAIKLASPSNFVGKVVIDTTNPLNFERVSHHNGSNIELEFILNYCINY
jgi:hypothetical protein